MDLQVREGSGHTDFLEEGLRSFDAGAGDRFLGGRIRGNIHHVGGELIKTGQVVLIRIAGPAAPDGAEAGTVGDVPEAAHFVFHAVADPVAAVAAAAGEAVVGETAGPHDFGAGTVVSRVAEQEAGVVHDRAQQAFGEAVGQFHGTVFGEVTFHGVHHDVGAAAGRLPGRQRFGVLRVHDGEPGPADVVVVAALEPAFLFRDDRGIAHFTARGGQGQDDADGQAGRCLAGVGVKVPDIAVVGAAVADGFGRVDDAAAADGQQKVGAFLPDEADAFTDQGEAGVGDHAAEFAEGDARFLQQGFDAVEKAAADDAALAVVDQDFFGVLLAEQGGKLGNRIFAEHDFRRGVVHEIAHKEAPFRIYCWIWGWT